MADNDTTVGRLKALRDWLIQSNPPVIRVVAGLPVTSWELPPKVKAIVASIDAARDALAANDAVGAATHTADVYNALASIQREAEREIARKTLHLGANSPIGDYVRISNKLKGLKSLLRIPEESRKMMKAEFQQLRAKKTPKMKAYRQIAIKHRLNESQVEAIINGRR